METSFHNHSSPHITSTVSCGNLLPQLHTGNNNLLSTTTVLPISSVVETSFHRATQAGNKMWNLLSTTTVLITSSVVETYFHFHCSTQGLMCGISFHNHSFSHILSRLSRHGKFHVESSFHPQDDQISPTLNPIKTHMFVHKKIQ